MASAEEAQAVIDKFNSYVSYLYINYIFIVNIIALLHFCDVHAQLVKKIGDLELQSSLIEFKNMFSSCSLCNYHVCLLTSYSYILFTNARAGNSFILLMKFASKFSLRTARLLHSRVLCD